MAFIFDNFGRFFFLTNFIVAWMIYSAPFFAGRSWLASGFLTWGVAGLQLLFFQSEYDYSETSVTIYRALDLVGYAMIFFAAFIWWRERSQALGSRSGVAPAEVGSEQVTSMIARNDSNSISKAEAIRDQIYTYFLDACKEEGIAAEVFKSPPFNETIWVEVRVQEPLGSDLSLRAHATVTVTAHEFHRFEQVLSLVVNNSHKTKMYFSVIELRYDEVVEVCRYLADKTRQLSLRPLRCRTFPWQLWRPKNKLVRIKPVIGSSAFLVIVGTALMAIPYIGLPLLLIGAVIWWVDERQRRVFSLTSGKPWQEPRILLRMDSWQAVVHDLSAHADGLKDGLLRELSTGAEITSPVGSAVGDRFYVEEEDIWYPGIDGKVQRRQIVVRLRRAIGFIHLYAYGNDLYVGWDAHINGGMWIEKMVGQGKERKTGHIVRAYGVATAWHTPNEYDITDANFLIELIHSIITKIVRQALKEHEVDQEIDFTIVREPRHGIAGTEKPGKKEQERKLQRFRRVA